MHPDATARYPQRAYLLASIALFALFALLVFNHALYFIMDGDEAYNSTTAKNWLLGYGYASSIGVIFPFDPYISSGPAYTALLTLPFSLWGFHPDLPKPFLSTAHLLLLAMALRLGKDHCPSPRAFFWLVAFCLGWFCVVEFRFWHRSAGELLSFLYLINAALLLARAMQHAAWRPAFAGGFLAACALLTKQQAIVFIAGLFAAILLHALCHRSRSLATPLLAGLAGLAVPLVGWHLYKAASLQALAQADPHLYDYYLGKDWHFFATHGSGMNLFWETRSVRDFLAREANLVFLGLSKMSSAFSRMAPYWVMGGLTLLLMAATLVALAIQAFIRSRNTTLLFLALPVLAFLGWALFLNNSIFMHQMLPGIWLILFGAGLALCRYPRLLALLAIVALAITLGSARRSGDISCDDPSNAACIYTTDNPLRLSRQRALDYLRLHPPATPMANCGWYFAHDIEFSLPGTNNIRDCMRLFDEAVRFDAAAFVEANHLPPEYLTQRSEDDLKALFVHKRKNLFGASFIAPVQWVQPLSFIFIANPYMLGESLELKRNVGSFLEHCQTRVFDDPYYPMRLCRPEDLQAYVQTWGGLPIFTHSWEAIYYHQFRATTQQGQPFPNSK